ncbi:MAG: ATP-dependent protease ATPase subunit HslU [Holosporaceae bacterium]
MTNLAPKDIVAQLDRHIIGQEDAKRAVAIALRNRWRRLQLNDTLKDEVSPKNILMIGPTGCGKTEIARRLARLAKAPFLKVEATKFTEVGYMGRDVEQIGRDLVEIAIEQVKTEMREKVAVKAKENTNTRLIEALVGQTASDETKASFQKKLDAGALEKRDIEIQVQETQSAMPSFDIPGMPGAQMGMINLGDLLGKSLGGRTKNLKTSVKEARHLLMNEESEKLLDQEKAVHEAIKLTEENGIVFIDEIDKICARSQRGGSDVSREGVQRDLLPLLEGTTISTKHGMLQTDHILFITSGAFHLAKPADLLPELQGRLPIRVELKSLTKEDFERVLIEPEASLLKQYKALLATEGVTLDFQNDAIREIAHLAADVNASVENIGARRLQTLLERLLEDISFHAPDRSGETVVIDVSYVRERVAHLAKSADLSRFIL